jgi:BCD family chlorophyll transporter-like MFS transporter
MMRLLAVIACGTAGFGMADVILEPFGGQVLGMTVSQTTFLTVFLALGSLVGFALASALLLRGRQPLAVAASGAALGIPAFALIILAAGLGSAPVLSAATVLAGFGAGLFGHGTLTATMRSAPRDQMGLALGAWGTVQTTAAGLAIAIGGVIRDILARPGDSMGAGAATPYIPVFVLEMALLALALVVALPLLRRRLDKAAENSSSSPKATVLP